MAVPVPSPSESNSLWDEPIVGVVFKRHHLRGRAAVGGAVGDAGEPVAVVPRVFGDRRVARVQRAARIGVDEPGGSVAVGVVGVRVAPVRQQPVVVARGVARVGAVPRVIIRI